MKILHTSDWHLGKKLESISRLDEQREVLDEICNLADNNNVDVILIAGDLFDTFNPPTDATDLFYKTLKRISKNGSRPVFAIAGNHDSPDRIETVDTLAKECGIFLIGYPTTSIKPFSLESGINITISEPGFIEVQIPEYNYPLRLLTTPYANEIRLKKAFLSDDSESELRSVLQKKWTDLSEKYCNNKGVNVLTTHLFVISKNNTNIPEEPEDEKPILHIGGAQAIYTENFPENIQYVALGHLHKKQIVQSNNQTVVYSGSPLSYSFSEANQSKFVSIVKLEPNKDAVVDFITLKKGKRLTRLHADGIEDAIVKLKKHKNDLIELNLITDNYLTATERNLLFDTHSGIVTLIPNVNRDINDDLSTNSVDINKNITDLFAEYFKYVNQQDVSESTMNLFKEVLANKEDI